MTKEESDLYLRPVKLSDKYDLYEMYSSGELCKYYDIDPYTDIKQAETQIESWIKLAVEKKQFRYGIIYENRLIGTCGLYSIYWHQGRASLGYDMNKAYWSRGLTTKALTIFMDIIKDNHNLHRIQATVKLENISSVKVLKKLSFEFEGVLKDYEKWRGEYVDLAMYSRIL